jgi:hypothetical protein
VKQSSIAIAIKGLAAPPVAAAMPAQPGETGETGNGRLVAKPGAAKDCASR